MSTGIGFGSKIRHFWTAYTRNLRATRLLSAIAIVGLAVGLAGALMLALVARNALGFYGFVPDRERTYEAISIMSGPGMAPNVNAWTHNRTAGLIRANLPDAEAVGRLSDVEVALRRNGETRQAKIYWADPEIFDLLRLPVLAGRPKAALSNPDGLVMTQSEAVRLFGRANALGAVIDVDGTPMVLRAVIADPPAGMSEFDRGIFASGKSAKAYFGPSDRFVLYGRTYLRLRQGVSPAAVERRLTSLIGSLMPVNDGHYAMRLLPIGAIALHPGLHPGARERLEVGSLVAAFILFIAVANYVNLSTALSARRWREIGVRAVCGATRGRIALQFLGEAVATVLIALLLGAALVELTLPSLNSLFQTQATFDYLAHPMQLLWLIAGGAAVGLAAGAYPAFVLSGLSPAALLRDRGVGMKGRSQVTDLLVAVQFAILIGLMIALAVVYQQRRFAMTEALRLNVDQVVVVNAPCPTSFRQEVAKLPGVRGTSCAGGGLLEQPMFFFAPIGNGNFATNNIAMLPSGFSLFDIAPIAGSLSVLPVDGEEKIARVVVNQTAVQRFGLGSASAAIGKLVPFPSDQPGGYDRVRVVAVVPDFSLLSVETPIKPAIYVDRSRDGNGLGLVLIKLSGREIPETLTEIDRLWRKTGQQQPIQRRFVSDHIEELYRDLERSGRIFALFCGVAALLSATGIAGMAIATAERRTKEIGIRKALGARTGQVLVLLLARMSRPALWANLIAWPCAWWLMRNWLNGFAYRVPLHWWLFPAAAVVALAITLGSAGLQALNVARRRPIEALRYE